MDIGPITKTLVEAESRSLLANYKWREGPTTSVIGGCLVKSFGMAEQCSCGDYPQMIHHEGYAQGWHVLSCEGCPRETRKHKHCDNAVAEWNERVRHG